MPDLITNLETALSNEAQAAVTEVTGLFGQFEAFMAHNGATATQQAVVAATTSVTTTVAQIETAVQAVADDVVTYLTSKIPGGNVVSPAGIALVNALLAKAEALIAPPPSPPAQ